MAGQESGPLLVAARIYGEAAGALNGFFGRHTAAFCSDCLEFHKRTAPDDPIGHHRLVSGVFPGCCQEGVADDARIPELPGARLPQGLAVEIAARRPPRPGKGAAPYVVEDERDLKRHEGRGCQWLGEHGCALGPWKSPLCLSYLCPPLLAVLAGRAGGGISDIPRDYSLLLELIGRVADGGEGLVEEAERALCRMRDALEKLDAALSKPSSAL